MATDQRPRRSKPFEAPELDAIDQHVLSELQFDARVSMAELGRRVGLSAL